MSFNPATPGFHAWTADPRGFNIATPTNANEIPLALTLGLPRDGGFGQVPTVFGSFGNTDDLPPPFGHFELEEFNSPPVVESADTGPFFHNHTVPDIEAAVAFYGTPAFKDSLVLVAVPVDISADPADPDVQAIAAFLRVLNALENIRSSIDVAERGADDEQRSPTCAIWPVCHSRKPWMRWRCCPRVRWLHQSEPAIRSARRKLIAARVALDVAEHLPVPWAIDHLLGVAVQQLRGARSALANPATLPPSFRN